jgi:putative ATP-dependent endonuclease of OLD family
MYLRSIEVENYRAIRKGSVSLEKTTVLIGENDCGRSSIIEALMLLLGDPADNFESRLKPLHFHRSAQGSIGPLRIRMHLAEQSPGQWTPPDSIRRLSGSAGQVRQFDFEFRSTMDLNSQEIRNRWYVAPHNGLNWTEGGPDVLAWLRSLVPALWLRSGLLTAQGLDCGSADPIVRALRCHYHNLMTGDTPDLAAELEQGTQAARTLLQRHPRAFSGAASMMSAMASDILNRQRPGTDLEPQSSTAAHKIGLVLLIGSLLQLSVRSALPDSMPLLVIEIPESNLHPITLANVWRMIERLTWQQIIATNSGTLLLNAPLGSIRRLTRCNGIVKEWSAPPRLLSRDELRRVSYHVRARRGTAMFARCWLLVEGETEFWILPELARVCGFDFAAEGVACMEFAQCGVLPLTKLADRFGIAWHVLVDGDDAGLRYAEQVGRTLRAHPSHDGISRLTVLRERDIEHCFWHHGFDEVISAAAPGVVRSSATAVIRKAIEKASKPYLALRLIDAAAERGPASVPAALRNVIESSVLLARSING